MKTIPTDDMIRRIFKYNPETGEIVRIDRSTKSAPKRFGAVRGSKDWDGYLTMSVCRRTYKTHRIAWFLHYGAWPKGYLDHINRDKSDNRILNLRECSPSMHQQNKPTVGVSCQKGWWVPHISINKKSVYLGSFKKKEDAELAYATAKEAYHAMAVRLNGSKCPHCGKELV